MFAPLRNHVTSLLSHHSLSACKDGGYRELGLFTVYKKLPEILVGNFRSEERYVSFTICLKFPDCRAALDWILVTT